jgi:hypothetical protein
MLDFLIRSAPKNSLSSGSSGEEALFAFLDWFLFERNTKGLGSTSQMAFTGLLLESFFL